jgi:hypothetical protein
MVAILFVLRVNLVSKFDMLESLSASQLATRDISSLHDSTAFAFAAMAI